MLIYIQDNILEFDNDPKIIKEMVQDIDDYLSRSELQFSHFMVDDVLVSNDIYAYISKNIKNIKKVEVILETVTLLVNETILTTYDYIKNAMPLIKPLAEAFYRQPKEKTWLELNDLFGGMQWIIEALTRIDAIKNLNEIISYEVWNEYVQITAKLMEIIPELEKAILTKDMVLIGDMLLYEITPIFDSMKAKLQFLLPMEDANVS